MKTMELKVEGMMCAHCENRVNTALSQLDGMTNVKANAQANTVSCEFEESQVTIDKIKETIEDIGYDVVS